MIKFPFDKYAKTKEGARYLKDSDIENFAEEVLFDYNNDLLKKPQKIDWSHFLEFYLKCNICFAKIFCDDPSNEILGATSFDDAVPLAIWDDKGQKSSIELNSGEIVFDTQLEDQPQRLLFTAFHEAGHWMLQSDYYFSKNISRNQISIFGDEQKFIKCCRKADIEMIEKKHKRELTPEEHLEHQANVFSAAILLPKKLLIKLIPKLQKKYSFIKCKNIEELEKQKDAKWKIENEISILFGVSHQVAQIRLEKLDTWLEKGEQLILSNVDKINFSP